MNKANGIIITMLLSVAVVLVAPQAFAATGDWLSALTAAPSEINTGIPGEGEKYPSDPVVTCTIERPFTDHLEGARAHMEAHPEIAALSSSCSGASSDMPYRDVEGTGIMEIPHY